MPTEMLKATNCCKQQLLQKRLNTLAIKKVGRFRVRFSNRGKADQITDVKYTILTCAFYLTNYRNTYIVDIRC